MDISELRDIIEGLNGVEAKVFLYLCCCDERVYQKDLVKRLGIGKGSISMAINSLLIKGLIDMEYVACIDVRIRE